jgi:hypothetical protein
MDVNRRYLCNSWQDFAYITFIRVSDRCFGKRKYKPLAVKILANPDELPLLVLDEPQCLLLPFIRYLYQVNPFR